MKITLENIGRRFNRDWIFRTVDYTFQNNGAYAILGPNGSGKSTLLQILSGSLAPSLGTITYSLNNRPVDVEQVYQHLSIAAPYLELIEDFSLDEMIDFHFSFKTYRDGMDKAAIINLLNLKTSRNKLIKYFSSGMKQRAKLILAFCSDTPLLLLDEPTSNLDVEGVDWYLQLISGFAKNRLTIISSNQPHEYSFCNNLIQITNYKG